MSKKLRAISLLTIVLIVFTSSINGQATGGYIDKSKVDSGIINISYNSNKSVAVRVSKGNINYDYILNGNNIIPLQSGDGDYTISILENVEGKKFKQVAKEAVTLKLSNPNEVYLQSIQMINWNNEMDAIKKAKELTKNAKSDKEKVTAIYKYIMTNIRYDNNKASRTSSNYIPNIEDTLKAQKGICYDYASLTASMLRSVNVPTKLIMGYKSDIKEYHAWNQVYLQDTNEWIIIDTTYDAGLKRGNPNITMIKDAKDYKIEKQY
ncbi:transglutaminase-like domain-containing protein [Tissierella praeacuta]|uniref:transglutaminase-like domain-containing protein n=1 Tax=Tissierella praeacuta TaxID=43131 RepID=UPI00333E7AC7